MACRRLPNGNTLISQGGAVEEVTPEGKRVCYREYHGRGLSLASEYPYILPNGHLFYRQDVGEDLGGLAEVDAVTGRELKRVALRDKLSSRAEIEPLANNHYLITAPRDRRVLEVDGTGQTVWEYSVNAGHATRLRNGDTLICCSQSWGNRVVAIDPASRMVWEIFVGIGIATRCRVCLGLVRLGFDAPYPADLDLATSIRYRLKGLKSKDAAVRRLSVYALAEMDPKGATVVPALIEALDDPAQSVRSVAREALVRVIGPKTLPDLLQATRDKRPNVRASATWLLWKFRGQAKAVVPILLEALHDENALVRRNAAESLRNFGAQKDVVVPALINALKDKGVANDRSESSLAQHPLGSIGMLDGVAETAANTLGLLSAQATLGDQAKAAVAALIEAIKASDGSLPLRYTAIWALGFIGSRDKTLVPIVVPTLIELFKDGKEESLATLHGFSPTPRPRAMER